MTTRTLSGLSRRLVLGAGGLIAAVALAAFVFLSLWIGAGVEATSRLAMEQRPGDRVAALLAYVEDTGHPLKDRNRAVWALGQLGDRRALAVLRKHHTGGPCDHRSALCQRELAKGIRLLDGRLNATAVVWRHSEAD
jgi:hypothetical protein